MTNDHTAGSVAHRRTRRTVSVFLLYTLIAVAATWPLVRDMRTHILADPGDPSLNASILVWNATTIPLSPAWYNAPHYYPTLGVTTLTEGLLGVYPISSPIYWLTGNHLLAYNVTIFLTWPLAGIAVFLLVRVLTEREDAAFLAGLAFAFTPYRAVSIAHLQTLATFGIPLSLAGMHGYLKTRRWAWLALCAIGWLHQGLANGYYILYGSLVIGLWLLYFGSTRATWKPAARIAGAVAVGTLPMIPMVWTYRQVHNALGLHRALGEIMYFSAGPQSWFEVGRTVWLWHRVFPHGKDNMFLGITAVTLAAAGIGVLLFRRGIAAPRERRWLRVALGTIVALATLAIALRVLYGPIDATVASIRLRIVTLTRPVVALLAAGLPLVWLTPRLRRAISGRSPILFYAAGFVIFSVLACGPVLKIGEHLVIDPTPYGWLMHLPGFNELRVPTQIKMIPLLCVCVTAGLSYVVLLRDRARHRHLVFGIVAVGILLDGWTTGTEVSYAQESWPVAEPATRPEAILELPLGPGHDTGPTLRAALHHRRVMNGVSGYDPPHYEALKEGLAEHDPALLQAIAALGPIDIVVDGTADPDGAFDRYAASAPGAVRVIADGPRTVYRVPRAPAVPVSLGPSIPIARTDAIRNKDHAKLMHDGRTDSGWDDYPQRPDGWVIADLGAVHEVAGVANWLGGYFLDFPRRVAIDLSIDGAAWDTVWQGSAYAQAFQEFAATPRNAVLRFAFDPRPTRYIRLRQLGTSRRMWRVLELTVHAPAAARPPAPGRQPGTTGGPA